MPRSPGTVELSDAAVPHDAGIRCVANSALPAVAARPSTPPARLATIEPLSSARYKVQFTARAELREKLLRLQAMMRSSVPDGDLGAIIEAAVTEKLQRLEARRFGKTASPRKVAADVETTPTSRHIPAAVRRAVHERDGGRCTYRDARGIRCPARHGVEFHHHGRPFGYGGEHSAGNVRLMCRAHNRRLAESDYGMEKMTRHRSGAGRAVGVGADVPGGLPQAMRESGSSSRRTRSP